MGFTLQHHSSLSLTGPVTRATPPPNFHLTNPSQTSDAVCPRVAVHARFGSLLSFMGTAGAGLRATPFPAPAAGELLVLRHLVLRMAWRCRVHRCRSHSRPGASARHHARIWPPVAHQRV